MRKITQCLNPTLAALCEQTIKLESLTAIVQDYFKPLSMPALSVASFNKGCLIITVENAIHATELRYSLPALRDHLRRQMGLHQLVTIKVQLMHDLAAHLPPRSQAPQVKLSSRARAILLENSQQCQYEPLRLALLRLSRH